MTRRPAIAAVCILASVLTFSGCGKPSVGGKCTAGQAACSDTKSGVFCGSSGTYKAMTCGGPNGCKGEGAKVECDNDVSVSGDGCNTPNDGACTPDHRNMLLCKNEAFALVDTCKGPGACKIGGGNVVCDNDVADIADPCSNIGNYACTSDRAAALRCDANKYTPVQSCRGPKACAIVHPSPKVNDIDCDFTVAAENDPCVFPDNEACTSDRKSMLTCKGGKYTNVTPCPGPNGCTVTVTAKSAKVTCDGSGGGGPVTPDAPFVAGDTWVGTYFCKGNHDMTLKVGHGAPDVAAVFGFQFGTNTGSFNMKGKYEAAARHLRLTAGSWVKKPAGFVTVNLDGKVTPDGHIYTGTVQGPGCSTFTLKH
jgi:hypothetical protein